MKLLRQAIQNCVYSVYDSYNNNKNSLDSQCMKIALKVKGQGEMSPPSNHF